MKTNPRHLNKYRRRNGTIDEDDLNDLDKGKPTQKRAPGSIQGLSKKLKKNDGQGRGQRTLHREAVK